MPLTLASQSPRRAKILAEHGVDFVVTPTHAPEVSIPHDPERTVLENARAKLRACAASPALAADTIVWFNGKIYGKPADLDEAKVFLRELAGRTHTVFTGVAYRDAAGVEHAACERSGVTFRALTEDDIAAYVARVRPTDRAGAYDIDGGLSADGVVASWSGSFENVMGLPTEPLRLWHIL